VTASRWTGVSAIVVRELRGRMRGRKAFIFLTFYLAVLAGLLYISLRGLGTDERFFGALESANIGRGLFIGILAIETLVVAALAPAYTAGTISQERERQTYDLLVATPITSVSIALGKLVSGLAYLLVLVLASIPIAAIGFFFGGVEPASFVAPYVVLIAGAIGLGAVGIFFSALLKRTQAASIATYLCLVIGTIGAIFITDLWRAVTDDGDARPPEVAYYFNPYFAQADAFCHVTEDFSICNSVPAGFRDEGVAPQLGGNANAVLIDIPQHGASNGLWMRASLFWLGMAGVMLLGAARFISPTHRWRPGDVVRALRGTRRSQGVEP
jgi:hypothetical protein